MKSIVIGTNNSSLMYVSEMILILLCSAMKLNFVYFVF